MLLGLDLLSWKEVGSVGGSCRACSFLGSIPLINRFLFFHSQKNRFGVDKNKAELEAVKPKWNPKGEILDSFVLFFYLNNYLSSYIFRVYVDFCKEKEGSC